MTIREGLHRLVDQLDDTTAGDLLEYARWLAANQDEPLSPRNSADPAPNVGQPAPEDGELTSTFPSHERLQEAVLAARTAQHALNNQLATVVGYTELLIENPLLTGDTRENARDILAAAQAAAATVARLGRITRLEQVDQGGLAPVLDLPRSVEQPSGD